MHVMGIAPAERPRAVGVIGHRVEVGRVRIDLARGLPVVSAPDAWIQLAPDLSPLQLVEAGDSLIRRKDPLSSWPLIRAALDRHRGSRGIRRAVCAVGFIRAGTDSVRETRLRLILHRGGLPVPEVNGVIELGAGRTTHGDLVLRRVLGGLTTKQAEATGAAWSPWRAYALFHLWAAVLPTAPAATAQTPATAT